MQLTVGEKFLAKKSHPCGGNVFVVRRVGSLCRIECATCGHPLEIDRVKLEKMIKKIIEEGTDRDNG